MAWTKEEDPDLSAVEVAQVKVFYKATDDSVTERIYEKEDGYLGHYNSGTFEIEIAPTGNKYLVLRQDQDNRKTLHPINLHFVSDTEKLFRHTVPIYPSKLGTGVTKYPTNHVKLVWIYSNEKAQVIFQLWEIAIVTQRNEENGQTDFFLTTQLTNESPIYKNAAGDILLPEYPGFTNWESLQYYTAMLVVMTEVPDIALWPAEKKQEPQKFENNTGKVLWYNLAQQFGLVVFGGQSQIARVHWSEIRSDERLMRLETGQMVRFIGLVQPTKTTTRATTVQWELKGVEVVN